MSEINTTPITTLVPASTNSSIKEAESLENSSTILKNLPLVPSIPSFTTKDVVAKETGTNSTCTSLVPLESETPISIAAATATSTTSVIDSIFAEDKKFLSVSLAPAVSMVTASSSSSHSTGQGTGQGTVNSFGLLTSEMNGPLTLPASLSTLTLNATSNTMTNNTNNNANSIVPFTVEDAKKLHTEMEDTQVKKSVELLKIKCIEKIKECIVKQRAKECVFEVPIHVGRTHKLVYESLVKFLEERKFRIVNRSYNHMRFTIQWSHIAFYNNSSSSGSSSHTTTNSNNFDDESFSALDAYELQQQEYRDNLKKIISNLILECESGIQAAIRRNQPYFNFHIPSVPQASRETVYDHLVRELQDVRRFTISEKSKRGSFIRISLEDVTHPPSSSSSSSTPISSTSSYSGVVGTGTGAGTPFIMLHPLPPPPPLLSHPSSHTYSSFHPSSIFLEPKALLPSLTPPLPLPPSFFSPVPNYPQSSSSSSSTSMASSSSSSSTTVPMTSSSSISSSSSQQSFLDSLHAYNDQEILNLFVHYIVLNVRGDIDLSHLHYRIHNIPGSNETAIFQQKLEEARTISWMVQHLRLELLRRLSFTPSSEKFSDL